MCPELLARLGAGPKPLYTPIMGNLGSLDLRSLGGEARIRALLEDLVHYYIGVYPQNPLALAVWFDKSAERPDQNLLVLFGGNQGHGIQVTPRESLHWKTGTEGPPFLEVHSASVNHFTEILRANPEPLARYLNRSEVLYFNAALLSEEIKRYFNVITAPSGLIRGWYVERELYERSLKGDFNLQSRMQSRPEIGIIKTEESPDFTYAKGLPHVEVSQRWLPMSPSAIRIYTWYTDWQSKRPGFFLMEGGALYEILKFEVKTAPEYPARFQLLDQLPDDRYPEVYLRAVPTTERAAA
jgi:hypothetical protein